MIFRPDPTSLTARASSENPSVEKYRSHRSTGGMFPRLTKKLKCQLQSSSSRTRGPDRAADIPGICHEEQVAQTGDEDGDSALPEYASEQEILQCSAFIPYSSV